MENKEGFKNSRYWYKGNLHSHTTNSDGKMSPKEAVDFYRQNGYHFLCLSDHDIFTDYREDFNTEDFILLPGVEASALLLDQKSGTYCLKVHHIHGILGTEQMQQAAEEELLQNQERLQPSIYYGTWDGAKVAADLAEKLQKRGCITTYNHPIWSRVSSEEFIDTPNLFALEIYNYNTVNESGTGADTTYWDLMLRKGIKIHGFASDDNHNEGLFDDSFGGYIMVNANQLTQDEIIENLMGGNFYSSTGPELYRWGVKEQTAYVECSPVSRINFIAGNYVNAGTTVMNNGQELTKAEYRLTGKEEYVRVECIDQDGKKAWTNALFL